MTLGNHQKAALLLSLVLAGWVAGCRKREEEQFPASPAATPSASTPAAGPATMPSQAPEVDNQKTFAQAEAAMKAKDYEKAVEAALALQQQRQLTAQQAEAAHQQMVRLQQQLVGAVLSGDPKAKAAADRLRQAAAHR